MNRDDIVRMAQESELWLVIDQHCCEYGEGIPTLDRYPELERFAELVAAHEREACAKVCEDYGEDRWAAYKGEPPYLSLNVCRADPVVMGHTDGAYDCADAIRARSEK